MTAAAVRTEATAAVRRSQREFRRRTSPPASTAISVGNELYRHPNGVEELYTTSLLPADARTACLLARPGF